MKILQVCAVDFTANNFLIPLVDFLRLKGHQVDIVCTKGEYAETIIKRGYKLIPCRISRNRNIISHIFSIIHLYFIIKKGKYDVVHTHTPVAGLVGRIAAWLAGTKLIFYTAHGFYFHEYMQPSRRKFHIRLEKFAGRFCDFIFVQSDEDRRTAIKEKIVPEMKVLAIGNGIDLKRFDPNRISPAEKQIYKKQLNIAPQKKVVTIVGRLVKEKGYIEFFKAARLILNERPHTKFLVVGGALESEHDNSTSSILSLIEGLGIKDNVILLGFRQDVEELLNISNIFVLPSYREGMPRSIIEAMAMGLPVVATDIRGIREEVIDGDTGFLVPVGDEKTLAQNILTLLKNDELAINMGKMSRERALTKYSEEIVFLKQWQIYEAFAKAKKIL